MKAIIYFLLYPLIFLIGKSPFWVLYRVSDLLYLLVYDVFGYRKSVVFSNLAKSFPDKSQGEITAIAKGYYQFLCDIVLESIKTTGWTEREARSRVHVHQVDMLNQYHDQGKSLIVVMGHQGNWEWAGPGFSLNCKHRLFVVYKPLSNPWFERLFVKARTKFNTQIIPKNNTLRAIVTNGKSMVTATALIADQAPTPVKIAKWMPFLNQNTPVYNGPEKISKKMGFPIVYMRVVRVKRGFYEVHPIVLSDHPEKTAENEITTKFMRLLEADIREKPETWLWSHKRWKHQLPAEQSIDQ